MSSAYTVRLRGLRFHVPVGILPHEKELPQPLEIDVTVDCDPATANPGSAGLPGVDYRELQRIAAQAVAGLSSGLLEEIAVRITDAALRLDAVRTVSVAIRKPHVPLPGPLDYAEVCLSRSRDG